MNRGLIDERRRFDKNWLATAVVLKWNFLLTDFYSALVCFLLTKPRAQQLQLAADVPLEASDAVRVSCSSQISVARTEMTGIYSRTVALHHSGSAPADPIETNETNTH